MANRYVILGFYRYLIVAEQVGCYIVELESALTIYRRAVADGIIKHGEKLLVHGDLDELLNRYEWGDLVTAADEKLPPVDAPVNALNGIESAKAKRAAVDAKPKRNPRKPYHVWQPSYKWPPSPRVIRLPVLGEVS